jgi:hypothetical protein
MKANAKDAQMITLEPISVDIIERHDGAIQSLRAYFGWRTIMPFAGEGGPRAG